MFCVGVGIDIKLNDFSMGRYKNMQNADLKDCAIRKYCVTSCDI